MSYLKSRFHFKIILSILLIGIASGIASSVFLHSLDFVTHLRLRNNFLIYFLPIGGLISTFLYIKFGGRSSAGGHLIIDEIHDPKERVPLRMAPFVLVGTIITHLFGGSAGREGTAVQMGGALAEWIGRYFSLSSQDRRRMLIIGMSAGFGSALGAPLAGMFFGSEVIHAGKIEKETLIESGIASWFAYLVTHFFRTPHSNYPFLQISQNNFHLLFLAILSGVIFGLISNLFSLSMHLLESKLSKIQLHPIYKTSIGGALIVILYLVIGSFKYAGLGIESIQQSFHQTASLFDIMAKIFFTVLTLAFGFKGGEFIPLVFIGSHTGSYLTHFFPNDIMFLTSLGFCAVFAGASNAPFTSVVMACEFFGWHIFPFALIACYVSYLFSGHNGIYKTQKVHFKKEIIKKIIPKKKVV